MTKNNRIVLSGAIGDSEPWHIPGRGIFWMSLEREFRNAFFGADSEAGQDIGCQA